MPTLYVAKSGNDGNDGTAATAPLRTFAQAAALSALDTAADWTVLARAGDRFDDDGTPLIQNRRVNYGVYADTARRYDTELPLADRPIIDCRTEFAPAWTQVAATTTWQAAYPIAAVGDYPQLWYGTGRHDAVRMVRADIADGIAGNLAAGEYATYRSDDTANWPASAPSNITVYARSPTAPSGNPDGDGFVYYRPNHATGVAATHGWQENLTVIGPRDNAGGHYALLCHESNLCRWLTVRFGGRHGCTHAFGADDFSTGLVYDDTEDAFDLTLFAGTNTADPSAFPARHVLIDGVTIQSSSQTRSPTGPAVFGGHADTYSALTDDTGHTPPWQLRNIHITGRERAVTLGPGSGQPCNGLGVALTDWAFKSPSGVANTAAGPLVSITAGGTSTNNDWDGGRVYVAGFKAYSYCGSGIELNQRLANMRIEAVGFSHYSAATGGNRFGSLLAGGLNLQQSGGSVTLRNCDADAATMPAVWNYTSTNVFGGADIDACVLGTGSDSVYRTTGSNGDAMAGTFTNNVVDSGATSFPGGVSGFAAWQSGGRDSGSLAGAVAFADPENLDFAIASAEADSLSAGSARLDDNATGAARDAAIRLAAGYKAAPSASSVVFAGESESAALDQGNAEGQAPDPAGITNALTGEASGAAGYSGGDLVTTVPGIGPGSLVPVRYARGAFRSLLLRPNEELFLREAGMTAPSIVNLSTDGDRNDRNLLANVTGSGLELDATVPDTANRQLVVAVMAFRTGAAPAMDAGADAVTWTPSGGGAANLTLRQAVTVNTTGGRWAGVFLYTLDNPDAGAGTVAVDPDIWLIHGIAALTVTGTSGLTTTGQDTATGLGASTDIGLSPAAGDSLTLAFASVDADAGQYTVTPSGAAELVNFTPTSTPAGTGDRGTAVAAYAAGAETLTLTSTNHLVGYALATAEFAAAADDEASVYGRDHLGGYTGGGTYRRSYR